MVTNNSTNIKKMENYLTPKSAEHINDHDQYVHVQYNIFAST
jgi:hypothetical protein